MNYFTRQVPQLQLSGPRESCCCPAESALQVEGLVNQYASGPAVRYGLAAWVVGSACAGAADAVVASVVNGEAAACSCSFVSVYCRVEATVSSVPG